MEVGVYYDKSLKILNKFLNWVHSETEEPKTPEIYRSACQMGGGGLDTELWTVIRHGDYTVILTTSSQVSQSGLETRPDLTFTELYSSGGRE